MNESAIPPPSRLFVLVAGEASGDQLGAGLIGALRERFPDARFAGIGGPRMIAAGFDAWYPAEKLAVMGLVEVLRHLPGLFAIRRDITRRILDLRPDAFIGIDAPDFNLGVERRLKRAGIRTVHYVSPSVWAWRGKRAARIGRSADRVLCLFPMEPPIYARYGVDARFVGHPLADAMPLEPDRVAARAKLGLPEHAPVLALLPGSRLDEIARLGADFIAAAELLAREIPQLHIVAPMANAACRDAFESAIANAQAASRGRDAAANRERGPSAEGRMRQARPGSAIAETDATVPGGRSDPDSPLPMLVIDGHAQDAVIAADAVLIASGTATLEAMLAKRPMVVGYRIAALTYRIVKGLGLLKVDRYALPNVLAGRELVPELMQDACTPAALAAALLPLLRGTGTPPGLLEEYRRLHAELRRDANRSSAAAVAELLE